MRSIWVRALCVGLMLAAASSSAPSRASAQGVKPYKAIDILNLLREGVTPSRVTTLIARACVEDGASPAVRNVLLQGGATPALLRVVERFACEVVGAQRIELVSAPNHVEEGASLRLAVRILGATGRELTDRQVIWTSSLPSIARVAADGQLTALQPGITTITAQVDTARSTFNLTVNARAVELRLEPSSLELTVGQESQIRATVVGRSGSTLSVPVQWQANDPGVIAVGQGGSIRALAPGSTTLRAEAGGLAKTIPVTVVPATVARVVVEPAQIDFVLGNRPPTGLRISIYDANGGAIEGRSVRWTIQDSSIATVSTDGRISANAAGSTRVIAEVDGVFGQADLRVFPAPKNAGGAFAIGLVLPGGGQFYAGRPVRAILTIVAAGGAGAWGIMATRTRQLCRSPVREGDSCPQEDLADEKTERPRLATGAALAAAIAVGSALDAAIGVRRRNGDVRRVQSGLRLYPSVRPGTRGDVELQVRVPLPR
jgi:hypothetical protein